MEPVEPAIAIFFLSEIPSPDKTFAGSFRRRKRVKINLVEINLII